ncbi:hypothetical protein [Deinococcus yunweiensis]|uniref:hypothetical protein n=1 Tax=Deinococcus yunweiensis TaxID=367282 RepID=UPI00398EFAA3
MTPPVNRTVSALLATLPALEAAFADVPRPTRVMGCTNCCISPEELEVLSTTARDDLDAEALSSYANNAMGTVGSEADFRYFLPRLLQLAVTDAFEYPDRPFVIRTLKYVPWATAWTPAQGAAILAYLDAWWHGTLTEATPVDDVDEVLATLFDVLPTGEHARILATWLEGGRTALAHLATFVQAHSMQVALGKKWDVWVPPGASEVVAAWLGSGAPFGALFGQFERDPDAADAALFLDAAALLEHA